MGDCICKAIVDEANLIQGFGPWLKEMGRVQQAIQIEGEAKVMRGSENVASWFLEYLHGMGVALTLKPLGGSA
uniref:Uncharacterized protein n=1 Tax=viral metagenome TaxID=1070528 RepID=A0A6M3LM90_9ZZZZ